MSGPMTRDAYERLIAEDLAWLAEQPRTLEREHIRGVVERSADHEYAPRLYTREEVLAYGERVRDAWREWQCCENTSWEAEAERKRDDLAGILDAVKP